MDHLSPDLDEDIDAMLEVPGIGPGIVSLIEKYRARGALAELERLGPLYPEQVARIRRLPRMTPAILRSLKGDLGVDTVDDLRHAIESGAAGLLRGVGATTLELWRRILDLPPRPDMVPAHRAWGTTAQIAVHLVDHLGGTAVPAGAVRRVDEWVASADVVLATEDEPGAVEFLRRTAVASETSAEPSRVRLVSLSGLPVDVHLSPPGEFGSTLFEATGPESHVIEVIGASDERFVTEERIYQSRGWEWVPPPARELPIARAADAVRLGDIEGDLHLHTDWSPDGRVDLETLVRAAAERGYGYVVITDHTVGLRFGGLDPQAIRMQARLIQELRPTFPQIEVFHGAELNIDADGGLDVDDETLGLLDLAVAGVHSRFDLPRNGQTRRVTTALRHPAVRVLSHPTGRRIGIRPPLDLDIDAVVEAAAHHGVALEVNGHRDRLDMSSPLLRDAAGGAVLFAADSDAHRLDELDNMANAVATLQKAGIAPDRVVNTRDATAFREWAEGLRPG